MKLIFRPGRIVWVWALVLAAMASSTVAVAVSSFQDVPDNHPYHDAIQWLYENGITEGCGGSNYCPDRDVTRGEIALLLQRLAPLQLDGQGERRDPHGDPGPVGPAGADGIDGADGDPGPVGPVGADGADGTNGVDGAVGPAGADGADGVDGAVGPAGAFGTVAVRTATATSTSNGESLTATCLAGETVIGGGFDSGAEVGPRASFPDNDNGWQVIWGGDNKTDATVYVLCAA